VTGRAVPILPSRDLAETLAFYERLGFASRGAPFERYRYLIVGRGGIELHFWEAPELDPRASDASCYLHVRDADALHREWEEMGIPADPATGSRLMPPEDTDYGLREFALVDPSGNLIRVGSSVAATVDGVHLLLYTPQAEALREVLRDRLGWPYVEGHEPPDGWQIFALPPAELGVHPSDGATDHQISFMCRDLDAAVAELRARGIEFRGEPRELGFGIVATMLLPGGVEALLYEPRHRTAV
jgi:catechol 2,3-dioxygenase-like lactoylglutathione lyase family enzyme